MHLIQIYFKDVFKKILKIILNIQRTIADPTENLWLKTRFRNIFLIILIQISKVDYFEIIIIIKKILNFTCEIKLSFNILKKKL